MIRFSQSQNELLVGDESVTPCEYMQISVTHSKYGNYVIHVDANLKIFCNWGHDIHVPPSKELPPTRCYTVITSKAPPQLYCSNIQRHRAPAHANCTLPDIHAPPSKELPRTRCNIVITSKAPSHLHCYNNQRHRRGA